jgi:Holliday junction resolvase
MAKVPIMAVIGPSETTVMPSPLPPHWPAAERQLAEHFLRHGWRVSAAGTPAEPAADLLAEKGPLHYVVEVKSSAEPRADRVLPMLSQAILQASRHALHTGAQPLAVVHVRQASDGLVEKIRAFHQAYAPETAIGVLSSAGGAWFIGEGLEELNVAPTIEPVPSNAGTLRHASDLFSDLNQWMLKVLLAPEIPERLLHAPRGEYRTGGDLAAAAQVSAMSASRLLRRLGEEGFLDTSGKTIRLVRRRELFLRWSSAAGRSSAEMRMTSVLPISPPKNLLRIAQHLDACVGMFAAADLLGVGHVSGVLPYAYVRRLAPSQLPPGLMPTQPGDRPQLILKQALAPESLFRGAVRLDGALAADVLQILLDTASHPSRGREQAEFLRNNVLADVMGGS